MRRRKTKQEIMERFWRDLRYKVVEVVICAVVIAVIMWTFFGSISKQWAVQQAKIQQAKEASKARH